MVVLKMIGVIGVIYQLILYLLVYYSSSSQDPNILKKIL